MRPIGQSPQVIADTSDRCGEAPLWDWRQNCFFWDDVAGEIIHRMDWQTGEVISTPSAAQPSGMALASDGGLVIAGANGIHTFNDGKIITVMPDLAGEPSPWNDILAT